MAAHVLVGALLVTVWGIRLTFNFARKGGYSGVEDYRWPILRRRIGNPVLWQVFHLLFICIFQVGLFVLFTSPLYVLGEISIQYPGFGYAAMAALLLGFVLLETAADRQQWRFHQAKRAAADSNGTTKESMVKDIQRGFLSSGLFRYSRHPNYLGELGVWWCLYFLGAAQTGRLINWSIIGAISLTLLFVGSTLFTESITASKYPEYREYRQTTSAVVPLPRTAPPRRLRNLG